MSATEERIVIVNRVKRKAIKFFIFFLHLNKNEGVKPTPTLEEVTGVPDYPISRKKLLAESVESAETLRSVDPPGGRKLRKPSGGIGVVANRHPQLFTVASVYHERAGDLLDWRDKEGCAD